MCASNQPPSRFDMSTRVTSRPVSFPLKVQRVSLSSLGAVIIVLHTILALLHNISYAHFSRELNRTQTGGKRGAKRHCTEHNKSRTVRLFRGYWQTTTKKDRLFRAQRLSSRTCKSK